MSTIHKIGVRFCGGCNCYFDREALYEQIKKQLSDYCDFFHYSDEGDESCDLVVLINGCQSECLLTAAYDSGVLLINNKNYEHAAELIREYLKLNEN